jgi:hypothetical protein
MNLAKILAGAALIAAPLSTVGAQSASTSPADSGSQGSHAGKWLAGTGTVAGAALFLAFTHGHNASASAAVPLHQPNGAPSDPAVPSDGQPSSPPTAGNQGSSTNGNDSIVTTGTNQFMDITGPSDSTANNGDGQSPILDGPPSDAPSGPIVDSVPREEASASLPPSSTVPEPGTLALTATGIIGLLPLVRRRRR